MSHGSAMERAMNGQHRFASLSPSLILDSSNTESPADSSVLKGEKLGELLTSKVDTTKTDNLIAQGNLPDFYLMSGLIDTVVPWCGFNTF